MADENFLVEEPVSEYSQLDPNGYYTYLDYIKWTFKERIELIRGHLVKMSPAPNINHQVFLKNVNRVFENFLLNKPCEWYFAPVDVRLPIPSAKTDSTVVQPDLIVVCDKSKINKQGCNGAPDLVVEIISPGNSKHDMVVKFGLYEEAGVKEYWMVLPENRSILVYSLQNAKFTGLQPFTEGMEIESLMFPELKVNVDEIFRDVREFL